jgi:hypothetical protein
MTHINWNTRDGLDRTLSLFWLCVLAVFGIVAMYVRTTG